MDFEIIIIQSYQIDFNNEQLQCILIKMKQLELINYNELKKNIFYYNKKFKKTNFKIYNFGFGEKKTNLIVIY
jgi:hypothetical protein